MGRERWILYCALSAIALTFAGLEILERKRGRRWPVRLLVAAGVMWLFAGLWHFAMRGATAADRVSLPTVASMFAIFAAVPYVLLRADDQMRNDP